MTTGIDSVDQTLNGLRDERVREISPQWRDSPYHWTLSLSPAQKAKVGREVVSAFWKTKDLAVSQDKYILKVDGEILIRVKFSNDWNENGYFFQHIQEDCEYAFFLGVSPSKIHAWIFPIENFDELAPHYREDGKVHMHPNDKSTWPRCLRIQTGYLCDLTPAHIGIASR